MPFCPKDAFGKRYQKAIVLNKRRIEIFKFMGIYCSLHVSKIASHYGLFLAIAVAYGSRHDNDDQNDNNESSNKKPHFPHLQCNGAIRTCGGVR